MRVAPRINPKIAKSEEVATALTEGEYAIFAAAAEKAQRTISEWGREVAIAAVSNPPAASWFDPPAEGVRRRAVIVRMTKAQRAVVEEAASRFGVRKVSAFIRAAALAEAARLRVK